MRLSSAHPSGSAVWLGGSEEAGNQRSAPLPGLMLPPDWHIRGRPDVHLPSLHGLAVASSPKAPKYPSLLSRSLLSVSRCHGVGQGWCEIRHLLVI